MTGYKKPIRRSMLVWGLIFISIMCLLLSIQTAVMLRTALHRRYDAHLRDVLTHVENSIDIEDLHECIETGVPSEAYNELQQRVNTMVDDFELLYLYICIPLDDGHGTMQYVVASTSRAERMSGDTEDWPLMYLSGGFSREELTPYLNAWKQSPKVSTFEGDSNFGPCYTMCKPLVTADGETIGLLCADLGVRELHRSVSNYIWYSVALILFIAVIFSVGVAGWLRKRVTEPLAALEKSTRAFAEKSHGGRDPEQLTFDAPELHTQNEILFLSEAIGQMSEDMKNYVKGILSAEDRTKTAEREFEGMTRVAYEDVLTHVKSKVAYDQKKTELAQEITDGTAKFAIVMVDLNNLKIINNTYGLECGNSYVVSGSKIISEVYGDAPVYRIGGDEFVVILEDGAYQDRDELLDILEEKFREAQTDMNRELWERCSAAAGMAEFSGESDKDVDQVYRRAEKIMIRNKRMMKNEGN